MPTANFIGSFYTAWASFCLLRLCRPLVSRMHAVVRTNAIDWSNGCNCAIGAVCNERVGI